ncbi:MULTISPECIES: hypothetical protein [unclassified Streptomyces]|uniref:hypothetical protein n=1 Tax=unclassified Streptomyces TaxID=2593676 RepID=UPI002254294A|nr:MULTISPECIES: hypothetical protein [unclassified Streptomyces]MCX5052265.1 hypothetical protein [Streptomyces sp. NBC_00474]
MLGEPLLVGEVGHQVQVGDEQCVPPVQPPHEHRSVLAHEAHHLLDGGAAGPGFGDVDDGDGGEGVCGVGAQRGGGHGATTAFRGTGVLRSRVVERARPPAPGDYAIV